MHQRPLRRAPALGRRFSNTAFLTARNRIGHLSGAKSRTCFRDFGAPAGLARRVLPRPETSGDLGGVLTTSATTVLSRNVRRS